MKTEKQMAMAAAEFAERWKGRGYERGESQPFWIDLLTNVFGIETPSDGFITFEDHRMVDASNFIDGRIRSTKVLIEQKSLGKDLRAGIRQSDGSLLNPFQQARRYVVSLPVSEHPRWIVTCNFSEFLVYDMEQPNSEPEQILLENLGKEYYRLMFLVDAKNEHLSKEIKVSKEPCVGSTSCVSASCSAFMLRMQKYLRMTNFMISLFAMRPRICAVLCVTSLKY